MAEFEKKPIDLSSINGGNRYANGQTPSAETFNAPIEASAYVQALAENQPDTTNADKIGTPSVAIDTITGTPRFVFSNLKGEQGPAGPQGENGADGKDGSTIFYSTYESAEIIPIETLTPTGVKPLVGDLILFSNGDIRSVETPFTQFVSCSNILTNIKGADGTAGSRTLYGTMYFDTENERGRFVLIEDITSDELSNLPLGTFMVVYFDHSEVNVINQVGDAPLRFYFEGDTAQRQQRLLSSDGSVFFWNDFIRGESLLFVLASKSSTQGRWWCVSPQSLLYREIFNGRVAISNEIQLNYPIMNLLDGNPPRTVQLIVDDRRVVETGYTKEIEIPCTRIELGVLGDDATVKTAAYRGSIELSDTESLFVRFNLEYSTTVSQSRIWGTHIILHTVGAADEELTKFQLLKVKIIKELLV